jgi:hypothetical protein
MGYGNGHRNAQTWNEILRPEYRGVGGDRADVATSHVAGHVLLCWRSFGELPLLRKRNAADRPALLPMPGNLLV